MQPREPLSQRARGRWRGILPAVGVETRYLTGKHGPCPMCGGKDRFRFTDLKGAGTWICNQCGHGDGVELVKRLRQVDFKEAARLVEEIMPEVKADEPKKRLSEAEAKAKMQALWKRGAALKPDCFALRYLAGRGITRTDFSASVLRIADHPLMLLAKVVSPDGKAVNVHRTFLTADGRKAPIEKPKMMMEGTTPKGSAIRLSEPRDGELGIGEGNEDSLSAEQVHGVPCWSLWSADSLAAFLAPDGVRKLWIFANNDPNFHGQSAAMACARANKARRIEVEVKWPEQPGTDWNDILQSQGAA